MPFAAVSDRVKFVSYIFRLLVFKIIHYLSQSVRFEKGIAVLSYFTLSYVYELFHTARYGIKWTFKGIIIFKSSHYFNVSRVSISDYSYREDTVYRCDDEIF